MRGRTTPVWGPLVLPHTNPHTRLHERSEKVHLSFSGFSLELVKALRVPLDPHDPVMVRTLHPLHQGNLPVQEGRCLKRRGLFSFTKPLVMVRIDDKALVPA